MKAEVYFAPAELDPASVQGAAVVVVDVVRATTTIAEALANGARAIFPTASTEDAVRLAASLGREDTLLCGERGAVKVEGFDLGNSPGEFTPEVVQGKRLVMSTTNGTAALARVLEAERVVTAAFTNMGAVADTLRSHPRVVVVCAGRGGRFGLDDAVCAGHLLRRMGGERDVNDGARAAWALAGVMAPAVDMLAGTEAGRAVIAHGFAADLEICAQVDRHALVPELRDQALVAAGG
ncbi:MAG TPA: 2-phosphosulfolactate phosphatase [Longimicrobiales bacterium]|nr:2-phosphosulfolactate phosphatase [Longimicrobiales bacterium]